MKLIRGGKCPRTGECANPFKCSEANGSICSYLDGVKTRDLSTMRVVNSISCKHPEAKEVQL